MKPLILECGCAENCRIRHKDYNGLGCIEHGPKPPLAEQPDLTGRVAICFPSCPTAPSDTCLPFFKYRAGRESDSYYCGCMGWD